MEYFAKFCSIICLLFLLPLASSFEDLGCFKSIISFGDSLTDTGNLLYLSRLANTRTVAASALPYGETFFRRPTGRYSDGRLIVDFIAQSLGFPFLPPYIGMKAANKRDGKRGVNFAVAGSSALDSAFLAEKGIVDPFGKNVSLGIQMEWFKEMLQIFCHTPPDCKKYLESSLILIGEIGGNDYNGAFLQGLPFEEVKSLVPKVVATISSAINEMIKFGAQTLVVPGNLPIGCLPSYLTYFMSPNISQYDSKTGCINWLNKFAEYHNELVQEELHSLRQLHPNVTIIFADYYNAAMEFYNSPTNFGFENSITACCGSGGPYNYNKSVGCSLPRSTVCDNPKSYVSWDGVHFTEAAYEWIAYGLLKGTFATPRINDACIVKPPRPQILAYA